MLKATDVICTRNGAERVTMLLDRLRQQECPLTEWEVGVVDSTTDGRVDLVNGVCARLSSSRVRFFTEPRLGLSFARQRAASEVDGETIRCLDDDNLPAPDFASAAIEAFRQRQECLLLRLLQDAAGERKNGTGHE